VTIALAGFATWDDVKVSYIPLDNPSNRYSKDVDQTSSDQTWQVAGTISIQPNTISISSGGYIPVSGTLDWDTLGLNVEIKPQPKEVKHIEVDVSKVLQSLKGLEIRDET